MAKKKDKEELEQAEGKAIKNAKSLQDKQRESEEKLKAELEASVKGYFSNMFKYTLIKGILLLDVEQGVKLEHFEIINIEDIKSIEGEYVVEVYLLLKDNEGTEEHIHKQSIGEHRINMYTGEIIQSK